MEIMDQNLREKLKLCKPDKGVARIIDQNKAVQDNIDYVKKRASGEIKPLATCYNKLNEALSGGFEANTMLVISGLSGGGDRTIFN